MRKLFIGLLAPALAATMFIACGGDDSNGAGPGSTNDDGGSSGDVGTPPQGDGGSTPPVDGGKNPAPDAGDGGCNFATFVRGLITTDTSMTALPSTDLGQSCTDNQDQTEFQSLFP
jgi:hypothetical protein